MRSRRLCLVLLLPLLASGRLQSQQAPSSEEIEALMAHSGLQGQLTSLPAQIEQAIPMQDAGLDPKRVTVFRKAMATPFAADTMQARAREFIKTKLTREDAEQVMRWYSSPLGTRIRELESKAGSSNFDTYAAMQGDLAKTVGPERLKRIERIVSALEETEAVLLLLKHAGTSFVKIRYLLWGIDLPVDPTDRSAELKPKFERMMILARSDAFRDLTIAELDLYVAFAESPAARRWYPALWGALGFVLEKGAEEVLADMAKSLEYHTSPRRPGAAAGPVRSPSIWTSSSVRRVQD